MKKSFKYPEAESLCLCSSHDRRLLLWQLGPDIVPTLRKPLNDLADALLPARNELDASLALLNSTELVGHDLALKVQRGKSRLDGREELGRVGSGKGHDEGGGGAAGRRSRS